MLNIPEFTFIPVGYANNSSADLRIIGFQKKNSNEDHKPVIKESFFLLWIQEIRDIPQLKKIISKIYVTIPLDKVIFCNINLPEFISDVQLKNTLGIMIPLSQSIDILLNIPISIKKNQDFSVLFSNSISLSAYFWSLSQKLAFQLISEGNFIPIMKKGVQVISYNGSGNNHDNNTDFIDCYITQWKPVLRTESDFLNYSSILKFLQFAKCAVCQNPQEVVTEGLTEYLSEITDYLVRTAQRKNKYDSFSSTYGFMVDDFDKIGKTLPWDARFLGALIHKIPYFKVYKSSELAVPDIIKKWSMIADRSWLSSGFYMTLKLNLPRDQTSKWTVDLFLRSFDDDTFQLGIGDFWKILEPQTQLSNINLEESFQKKIIEMVMQKKWEVHRSLLEGIYLLGILFAPFERLLNEKTPKNIEITTEEATNFLEKAKGEIESNGIDIELPSQFVETGDQRLRLVMKVGDNLASIEKESNMASEEVIPSVSQIRNVEFDMNTILTYKWDVEIGDHSLTDEELKKITQTNERLVFWNNKWILLNQQELDQYKKMLVNNQRTGQIKASEAMNLSLSGSNSAGTISLTHAPANFSIKAHGAFNQIIHVLKGETTLEKVSQPSNFTGSLRPYQEVGFNWLLQVTSLGFGACLADDMGLGKTVQVIAYLQHKKNEESRKIGNISAKDQQSCNIIVCPTSVLSNWKREFAKFAPEIRVGLFYGPQRPSNITSLMEYLSHYDVILLSYTILRRDVELLSLIRWNAAILDESQNIKNYQSQQSQAAYKLQARNRIIMTGTPIENRLIELWSQYHFINPFLLGEKSKFLQRYRIPIERLNNKVVAEALRKNITPFLIRRQKSDKNIISDLPEKQEIKLYTQLSALQKRYYAETVEMGLKEIGDLEGKEAGQKSTFKRSGLILNMILKLKQVCNHPLQFAHEEFDKLPNELLLQRVSESGKLIRLLEMLEEIKENRDKILIFTQFTEMGALLERIIELRFQIKPLYLHGGVPQKKRDELVSAFQQDQTNEYPFFILSLKAGGTGLNLTAANFVLHFDRWWNPSVENQATDRAFRIGQKKNVMVYKMISSGTIEEKIDQMIENKKELAESIIATTGEDWITSLSTSDLKQLFTLEEDALEVENEK